MPGPLFAAMIYGGVHRRLDRDDLGLDQSKIMKAIYFDSLERDSSGKPRHIFRIPL
jgi:hypothetical protein